MGTLVHAYIWLDAYILHIPLKLFSWDVGYENVTDQPKLARSGMDEKLTQISSSIHYTFINIEKSCSFIMNVVKIIPSHTTVQQI